jgi:hypothetical protein
MADSVLEVNASTTFTLLDGDVEGHGWRADAPAVLNVTTADGAVRLELELELENTETDDVQTHADRVTLSPGEARELAAELESYADRVDD